MKKAAKWIILALTLLLAGGVVARVTLAESDRGYRNAYGRRGGGGFGNRFSRLSEKLGLTDEQADKIAALMTQARKKAVKARADVRVAGIELAELLTQDEVDKGKVDGKVSQIAQATEKMIRNRMDAFFQIREVLTPEQRKKAKPFIRRMFSRHAGGFFRKEGVGSPRQESVGIPPVPPPRTQPGRRSRPDSAPANQWTGLCSGTWVKRTFLFKFTARNPGSNPLSPSGGCRRGRLFRCDRASKCRCCCFMTTVARGSVSSLRGWSRIAPFSLSGPSGRQHGFSYS